MGIPIGFNLSAYRRYPMTGINTITKLEDTPQRLAAHYYGDWTLYGLIVDSNPNVFVDNVCLPGSLIFIPTPIVEEVEHTVVSGDSYGTERYSVRIAWKNNNLILTESIGLIISIPALLELSIYREVTSRT